MNKLFRWKEGRQSTGYSVMTLIYSKLLKLDCYILRYRVGAYIPAHQDKVSEGFKHYRLNIELKAAKKGGELICVESIFRLGPINLFRPDEVIHAVTKVEQGTRYVLSIGWIRKHKSL